MSRRRQVATHLPLEKRRCLYCLKPDGPFEGQEHVVPRVFGPAADRWMLKPGAVCDPCNRFLGRQVDAPFSNRYDIKLTRGLEGLRSRSGLVTEIHGMNPVARLDCRIGSSASVAMFVSEYEDLPNGGFRAAVRPVERDPVDIVARTIRALWKIALGVLRGGIGPQVALDPRWDSIREAVLGEDFAGYLVQPPFMVATTRQIDVNVERQTPGASNAVTFAIGGVFLATPLALGDQLPDDVLRLRRDGWTVLTTLDLPPREHWFELEPDAEPAATSDAPEA